MLLGVPKMAKVTLEIPNREVVKMPDERYELSVWDDLEDEEVDRIYEELYLLR